MARPVQQFRQILPEGGTRPPVGGGGGSKPATPSGPPRGAVSLSTITSTGGLLGSLGVLLVPFFLNSINRNVFAIYDITNFNTEEDCVYNFKMEDVKPGYDIDVHLVYLQYRDIGKVSINVAISTMQFNRNTGKSTPQMKQRNITIGGNNDNVIYSYFVDMKVTGERPQLVITRKANKGSLCLITAKLVGNIESGGQL